MTFYAKPDQTYREHVGAAYDAWKATVYAKRHLIERTAKQFGFSADRFLKGSLLTVAFHDIGKMIEPFQQMMTAVIQNKPFNKTKNYRHELVSFIYTAKYWHLLKKEEYLTGIPLEAVAVAGHHKPLNIDLTSFVRESGLPTPPFVLGGLEEAVSVAEDMFRSEGYVLPMIQLGVDYEDPFKSLASLLWNVLNKGLERDGADKYRIIYSLLKGILHYADWYGSGKQNINYHVSKDALAIIDDIATRCERKHIEFKGLSPFRLSCSEHSGHVIAIAPTGTGKTEASILWALKNSEEMGGAKIIYLLPTMVTANSIWNRLSDFFSRDRVGLTHSTANLFLNSNGPLDEEDKWENRRDVLLCQAFMKSVTVGTIDQLLTTGFNSGRWVLKETNAANAVIIVDEIHAYDGWTLGLIISAIRHFSELGTRFMLMSATLPKSLQQLLSTELKQAEIIRDETLSNSTRSHYFLRDHPIESAIGEIETAVTNGRKVLVVVNTVEACQTLAHQLFVLNPVCYHSRFILKDRKAIEDKIEHAKLTIATQVVEVSLDIDYDWLFTECAPPDALTQRAGRVNRYRDHTRDSRVYIFKASEKSGKIYNPINDQELLSRSFDAFREAPQMVSENDLIRIVDEVYGDYRIDQSEPFNDAIQQYRISQKNRSMILDSRVKDDGQEVTRQAKYEMASVIPKCFSDVVLSVKPSERQWYEVKLPLWYIAKHKEEINGIVFCDVNYDPFTGATMKRDEQPGTVVF